MHMCKKLVIRDAVCTLGKMKTLQRTTIKSAARKHLHHCQRKDSLIFNGIAEVKNST